jgi:hypothetical protein
MAKTVRIVGQGIPHRFSDEEAFQIVHRDKDGEYCPKHVWKEWKKRDALIKVSRHG